MEVLRTGWEAIAAEADALYREGAFEPNYGGRNAVGDGEWLAFYMFGDGEKKSRCKQAPQTCALLRRAFPDGRLDPDGPADTSWAFFSAL
eukprot:SAG22_NODE_20156_length_268_cov_0.609467_1_plen_89_part_11